MIKLSNGLSFDIIYNSGSLGFTGKGWLYQKPLIWLGILPTEGIPKITKTITLDGRRTRIKIKVKEDYIINQVGLHNKGFWYWVNKQQPKIKKEDLVIVSVAGKTIDEICYMIEHLNRSSRIYGVEVNISCPSFEYSKSIEDIILELEKIKTTHPIILKIGNKNNLQKVITCLKKSTKIKVININSYAVRNWCTGEWYGISGTRVKNRLWDIARSIVNRVRIPIIVPSVWRLEDILEAYTKFSDVDFAIGIASLVLKNPFRVNEIVKHTIKNQRMLKL